MPGSKPEAPAPKDMRCECGKLLARWEARGIVIKCGRCRRLVRIPFHAIAGRPPLR